VVGAGWIAQEAFMPGVSQTGNSTITAIVSGSANNAAKLAEFYGVEHVFSYEQYDQMLASDVADAVYVALPNSMHADYAIRALRAGKHALVEKPLATTEAECEAMIAAANESGAYLMTAYRLHNEPGTVEVLERIRSGEIGDPRIFAAVFSFVASPHNHRLKAAYWGGPLQDIGVYCLNAARHIFAAEPIEAVAVRSFGNGSAAKGKEFQQQVDPEKLMNDFFAAVEFVMQSDLTTGKVGITGFCYGGGVANAAAVAYPELAAAVPFYGRQPRSATYQSSAAAPLCRARQGHQ
jgi:predicted dehydrogenase